MEKDKDEIARAIAHQQKMLRVRRQRLQQRELQEAQYGLNVPPEVNTEIHDLTERIQRHEAEIARLQTEAAVDKLSLAEVEYQVLLAEVWDTPKGLPTVIGYTRLELARLRLGIAPKRGRELAHDICAGLAEETFYQLRSDFYYGLSGMKFARDSHTVERELKIIGRAIRLDPWLIAQLFLRILPPEPLIDVTPSFRPKSEGLYMSHPPNFGRTMRASEGFSGI
jgi:hypothetical protein